MSGKYEHLLHVNHERKTIYIVCNDTTYALASMKHVQVVPISVRKNLGKEVINSIANALTNTIANGDEKKLIVVRIDFEEGRVDIPFEDKLYVRGNLDYYKTLAEARALKEKLKRLIVKKDKE